jgi:HlyD family secretion protein
MFRQEALDHLSAPDQLDQLLRVVTLKSWIPLAVIAGGIFAALVWSVVGRIPVSVEGTGLLLYPQGVVSFQSPASGEITEFKVSVDDVVDVGQELGRLHQPELRRRLRQERERLEELRRQDAKLAELWRTRRSREETWIQQRRAHLEQRITTIERMAAEQRDKSEAYFRKQTEHLADLRERTDLLRARTHERFVKVQGLAESERATPEELTEAQRIYFDYEMKLADAGLRERELELKRIEADASYQQQMDLVAELRSDIEELGVELTRYEQLEEEAAAKRALEIQEADGNIKRLAQELEERERIVAGHQGRILEVAAAVGQIVREGQRLGALVTAQSEGELQAVAYYAVADGKKILADLPARVSPSTVQRERYGSILGRIAGVSSFPVSTDAVTNTVGSAEMARRLTADGDKIEVRAVLEMDSGSPSGFRWTSGAGPEASITAGTTVAVRTTVESRRPISYLIPALRQWGGSGE